MHRPQSDDQGLVLDLLLLGGHVLERPALEEGAAWRWWWWWWWCFFWKEVEQVSSNEVFSFVPFFVVVEGFFFLSFLSPPFSLSLSFLTSALGLAQRQRPAAATVVAVAVVARGSGGSRRRRGRALEKNVDDNDDARISRRRFLHSSSSACRAPRLCRGCRRRDGQGRVEVEL
jgi:hypothetical protein